MSQCERIIAEFCKKQKDNEWEAGWIEEWLMDKYCENAVRRTIEKGKA